MIEKSETISSLLSYINRINPKNEYLILVYDNSDVEQPNPFTLLKYVANKSNLYLSNNYNCALNYCKQEKADWLVLLDQDTELSSEYLDILFNTNLCDEAAIYVPRVVSKNNKILAPYAICKGLRVKYKIGKHSKIFSINSATVINVDFFVKNIGVFSPKYPLDFLDYWYFYKVNQKKGKIRILSATIKHNLSVDNDLSEVSNERYKNMLNSESRFVHEELDFMNRLIYKLRLYHIYRNLKKSGHLDKSKIVKDIIGNKEY